MTAGTGSFDTAMTDAAAFLARSLSSLLSTVFAELSAVKSPDIASAGFLSTYAAGSGIAIFVLVVMLARLFYRTSSGQMSGRQLADSLWRWAPGAMLLILFGPAFGQFAVQLTDAATMSIVRYFSGDVASLPQRLTSMVVLDDPSRLPGGPIAALLIMAVAFVGVGGLVGGLVLQTLTLYLTGAVMAVAFVATIDPATRGRALRLPSTWLGLLLAKPLLFFLIGALARILGPAPETGTTAADGWDLLMPALMGSLALLFAGLAPWSLVRSALPSRQTTPSQANRALRAADGTTAGAGSTMVQLSYRRLQGSLARQAEAVAVQRPRPAVFRHGLTQRDQAKRDQAKRDQAKRDQALPEPRPDDEQPVAFGEQAIDVAPPAMPGLMQPGLVQPGLVDPGFVHRGEPR